MTVQLLNANSCFLLFAGGKILLNNARLHLKRGKRYGLCGPNGAGKSTLMRSIANGQLDGFPPKEELRTVYVEHDIDASESNVPVVEYVYSDPILQDASHPAHKMVEEVLASVGFTEAMQQSPVSSLSGGWKMKLALGGNYFPHPRFCCRLVCMQCFSVCFSTHFAQ